MNTCSQDQARQSMSLLLTEYNKTITPTQGVQFNQPMHVAWINLAEQNLFQQPGDPDDVFYNIITKGVNAALKKINVLRRNFKLLFSDEIINYLLYVASEEFMDDYNIGELFTDYVASYVKYGTVVTRSKYINKKDSFMKVIPFTRWICHPVNWEAIPNAVLERSYVNDVLGNKNFDTTELREQLDFKKIQNNSSLNIYDAEGYFPIKDAPGVSKQQNILVEVPRDFMLDQKHQGNVLFLVSSFEVKEFSTRVEYRKKVENRTMGLGTPEESMNAQIVSNELANIAIGQLRASSKIAWWSDDPELDGIDLSQIDNNSIINVSSQSKLQQISAQPLTYGAVMNYLQQWGIQNQDQTSAQDVALGRQQSNTTLGATQLASAESDSDFQRHTDVITGQIERWGKEVFLRIIIGYFTSKKSITTLLVGPELQKFYNFLADKMVGAVNVERVLNGMEPIAPDTLRELVLEDIQKKDWNILSDLDLDVEDIIDKTRVIFSNEFINIQERINTLTILIQQAQANPQSPYDVESMTAELVSLVGPDIAVNHYQRKTAGQPPSANPQQQPPTPQATLPAQAANT